MNGARPKPPYPQSMAMVLALPSSEHSHCWLFLKCHRASLVACGLEKRGYGATLEQEVRVANSSVAVAHAHRVRRHVCGLPLEPCWGVPH
jgi:hypothetical protein